MEYHSGGSLPLLGRPRYCPGANANGGYLCETGHCCGETGCCTYYYELWWFWLLWTVLILFSCCCAYRHRRAKLRVQQQQRQREISLLAYHGASSYPSSMLDLSFLASLKLPSYEEVAAQPSTPPPPYSSVFTTPRYPQPPRAADPHLLTQHDPLLHRPLSDGPSSLSSDNSSSCSCDSCCPSSPCSSSLSAPVTYETDTSHASTPSEAAPLTLDVTMETIAAAATCLEVNHSRFASERTVATAAADISDAAREPHTSDMAHPEQTVTVALVTMATSPPSASEAVTPSGTASPIRPQLLLAPCSAVPTILVVSAEEPAEGLVTSPSPQRLLPPASAPPPPTPIASTRNSPTGSPAPQTLTPSRTSALADVVGGPGSVAPPDVDQTSAGPSGPSTLLPGPPVLAQSPGSAPSDVPQRLLPPSSDFSSSPDAPPKPALVPDVASITVVTPEPEPADSHLVLVHGSSSVGPDPSPDPILPSGRLVAAVPAPLGSESDLLVPPPPGSKSPAPALGFPSAAASSCPAIAVHPAQSPLAAPPPPPPGPGPPLTTPALLLDPLAALNQPDKGASSPAHASSLSPSPRATQSPPKQTLFSPCVDVFEAEPSSWETGEEEPDEEGQDEDEDMEADESQYRHRRLTGDSGIEVCRCRVEDEDEDEEEDEDEDSKGGDRDKKGGADTDLHDSLDCPARGQISTGEGLTLCNSAPSSTPACEDSGKVVIAMETM